MVPIVCHESYVHQKDSEDVKLFELLLYKNNAIFTIKKYESYGSGRESLLLLS